MDRFIAVTAQEHKVMVKKFKIQYGQIYRGLTTPKQIRMLDLKSSMDRFIGTENGL